MLQRGNLMYAGDYLNVSVRIPEAKFRQTPLLQFELMVTCPVCSAAASISHFAEILPSVLRDFSEIARYNLSYDDESNSQNLLPFSAYTRYIIEGLARKRNCQTCDVSSGIPRVDILRLRRQSEGYNLRPWVASAVTELGCTTEQRAERTPNDNYVDVLYFLAEKKADAVIIFVATASK